VLTVECVWHAYAGILHRQREVLGGAAQGHVDGPGPPVGEGMGQRIGEEFMEDQAARGRLIDLSVERVGLYGQANAARRPAIGPEELRCQLPHVGSEGHPREVVGLVQGLMDEGHRLETLPAVVE
jgi:hypothetical protein